MQANSQPQGNRVIAGVTVVDSASGTRQGYVGAAFHRNDLPTTVARSILHALNRQFEVLLKPVVSL